MMGVGHVACMQEIRNMYRILARKAERKKALKGLYIDESVILETDPNEIVCDGVYWINLGQDSVQWHACINTMMNMWVP
jgi:hypothetical protein